MKEMTDELLARIAARAADPKRRYMKAAEDEARIELPVEEIERREEDWTRRNLVRSAAATGQEMSSEEVERCMDEWRASREATRLAMEAQMRAWGQTPPATKSFIETETVSVHLPNPPEPKRCSGPPRKATGTGWNR